MIHAAKHSAACTGVEYDFPQPANVQVQQCKPGDAHKTEQQPQDTIIPHPAVVRMPFLNMSGIVKRNWLVDTSIDELAEWQKKVKHDFRRHRTTARQQFNSLYTHCIKKDLEIDTSYRSLPGTAKEWQNFRQDCVCLVAMRFVLFKTPIETVILNQGDEAAVMQKVVELRAKGRSVRRFEMTDFSKLEPDASYYIRVPASVLKWNNKLIFKGSIASAAYSEVAKYDRATAEMEYTQALQTCQTLDNEVTYKDSKHPDTAPRWSSFRDTYIRLSALQCFLYNKYKYDPFGAAENKTVDAQRSPAARQLSSRLQVRSPTHSIKVMPATFEVVPEIQDKKTSEKIYTKVNSNVCLCIERDEVVWRQGLLDINAADANDHQASAAQQPHVVCTRVESGDRFQLHLSGLLDGNVCSIHVDDDMLLKVVNANQVGHAMQSELDTLQDELRGYNIEQLSDLAMIGVAAAVKKYEEFRTSCIRYLILQYHLHGTPIVIASNTDNRPLVCEKIIEKSQSSLAVQLQIHQLKNGRNSKGRQLDMKPLTTDLDLSLEQLQQAMEYVTAARPQFKKTATMAKATPGQVPGNSKNKQYCSKR